MTGHARRERQQVDAVHRPIGRHGGARGGGNGGENVDMLDRHWQALAGGDVSRPADEEGHTDAAFEEGPLPAAIGLVDVGQARIAWPAIVIGEDDHRIVVDPLSSEGREDFADTAVERPHHRSINPGLAIADCRQSIKVALRRLEWRVGALKAR